MCGLAGIVIPPTLGGTDVSLVLRGMGDALTHRGPDDCGIWIDLACQIGMAHRRLSIQDLSAAGHQPMPSTSGRFIITFNGEIYNHEAIRQQLLIEGYAPIWRGHSDTETLLGAFEAWGIESTLRQCVGMFALAVWDHQERTLTLARDRMGEKPLYYGWVGSGTTRAFVFGSELKALQAYPGFEPVVCRESLAQYLRFCYVPAPRSIYKGIYKLEPGSLLVLQGNAIPEAPSLPLRPGDSHGSITLHRWWCLKTVVAQGTKHQFRDDADGVAALEYALRRSIKDQSIADVPLGAFLSGGVDSSAIVALMQSQSASSVKTFTIGFDVGGYDESPYARAVAKHLGTEHHEMRVTAQMAQDVIPLLSWMYDEPFADSSQVPTYMVSKAAREHVTVSLSGDAGDELFGGYNRYFWGDRVWARLAWLPFPIRCHLGRAVQAIPSSVLDVVARPLTGLTSKGLETARLGDKLHKLGARLERVKTLQDLYRSLVSEWTDPASLIINREVGIVVEPPSLLDDPLPAAGADESPLPMMYQDSITYLPDDILCKVDRAAMAVSLETRVPFLDHRVIETAWQLPLHMKIRSGTGKWALRQVLYKYVPQELIERPKAGFAMPIGQWLRGPLKDWAEELLSSTRLEHDGFFHPAPIRQKWTEHLAGRADNTASLWTILMFQSWLDSTGKGAA